MGKSYFTNKETLHSSYELVAFLSLQERRQEAVVEDLSGEEPDRLVEKHMVSYGAVLCCNASHPPIVLSKTFVSNEKYKFDKDICARFAIRDIEEYCKKYLGEEVPFLTAAHFIFEKDVPFYFTQIGYGSTDLLGTSVDISEQDLYPMIDVMDWQHQNNKQWKDIFPESVYLSLAKSMASLRNDEEIQGFYDIDYCDHLYRFLDRLYTQKEKQVITESWGPEKALEKPFMTKTELSLNRIVEETEKLEKELRKKVKGQDQAIQRLTQGIARAKLDEKPGRGKPLATFLFAGPPGVGKTLLAEQAAEKLHIPCKRFDMSAYSDLEGTHGLTGFKATYKAAEEGRLTQYVKHHPRCILIMDEIEKAHKSTQLLFLQILEGARLRDEFTEEFVNFENVILVFTTNCGRELYEDNREETLSEIPENILLQSLQEDESFPAELCSRFAAGNMIMFNHMTPEILCELVFLQFDAFMEEMKSHPIQKELNISYDSYLPALFLAHMGPWNDARVISSQSGAWFKEQILSATGAMLAKDPKSKIKEYEFRVVLKEDTPCFEFTDAMKRLLCKKEYVDFQVKYHLESGICYIDLCDFQLKKTEKTNTALRRFAKSSMVSVYEKPDVHFENLIGVETAKNYLMHFVHFIQNPQKYKEKGVDVPKGVLLYGPPGTGKTSLAKALATECNSMFFETTGTRLRSAENPIREIEMLFEKARAYGPSVIFIDEVDAIAKNREGADMGTHLLVNTLLTQMDGFRGAAEEKPVFVVAATNARRNNSGEMTLDEAFIRRFDHAVYVGLPEQKERQLCLERFLEEKNCKSHISKAAICSLSQRSQGSSQADLKTVVNNMITESIEKNIDISDELLNEMFDREEAGDEKENSLEFRRSVAYHEAGHGYISWLLGYPPSMITIKARGNYGGFVSSGQEVEKATKQFYLDRICIALAGRAAEMVYYGEEGVNISASSDLKQATNIALQMVCRLGMGSSLLMSIEPETALKTSKASEIMEEVEEILHKELKRAIELIQKGKSQIESMVEVLLEKSFIQGQELEGCLSPDRGDVGRRVA